MIDGFNLRFGPAPGSAPLSVASPSITVFVGPNNSGKSKVLQEIYASCVSGDRSGNKILDNIEFTAISREEAQADLDAFRSEPRPGDNVGANAAMIQIGIGAPKFTYHTFWKRGLAPTRQTIDAATSLSTTPSISLPI